MRGANASDYIKITLSSSLSPTTLITHTHAHAHRSVAFAHTLPPPSVPLQQCA